MEKRVRRTCLWRGASSPALAWFCWKQEKYVVLDMRYTLVWQTYCNSKKILLGLLHIVVKWVILCLHICMSVGGKLVLETTWWGVHLLTLCESRGNLILCYRCNIQHILIFSNPITRMFESTPLSRVIPKLCRSTPSAGWFEVDSPWLSSFCSRGRQRSTVRRYRLKSVPQQGFSANHSTLRRVNGRKWESSESEGMAFLLR